MVLRDWILPFSFRLRPGREPRGGGHVALLEAADAALSVVRNEKSVSDNFGQLIPVYSSARSVRDACNLEV